jgi:hypothetical protein
MPRCSSSCLDHMRSGRSVFADPVQDSASMVLSAPFLRRWCFLFALVSMRAAAAFYCPPTGRLVQGQRTYQRCTGEAVSCPYACCAGNACLSCGCDGGDSAYTGSLCSYLLNAHSQQDFCLGLRNAQNASNAIPRCTQRVLSHIYSGFDCGGCCSGMTAHAPAAAALCMLISGRYDFHWH